MLLSPGRLHVAKSYAWVMQEGSTRLWMNGKSSPQPQYSSQPPTSLNSSASGAHSPGLADHEASCCQPWRFKPTCLPLVLASKLKDKA